MYWVALEQTRWSKLDFSKRQNSDMRRETIAFHISHILWEFHVSYVIQTCLVCWSVLSFNILPRCYQTNRQCVHVLSLLCFVISLFWTRWTTLCISYIWYYTQTTSKRSPAPSYLHNLAYSRNISSNSPWAVQNKEITKHNRLRTCTHCRFVW